MKLLIACEESQAVCKEFRALGHEAYSCDLYECSGGHPEWHIKGDCLPILNGKCEFTTENGDKHSIDTKWDMIIAHPPCTRLCSSGQRWLYWGTQEYRDKKKQEQKEAIDFFMNFVNADCDKIAIENPIGIMSNIYRKPDCIYNPYDFEGETECKATCLWLKGLTPLKPTQTLPKEKRTQGIWKAHFNGKAYAWNNPETAKLRSKTPVGVAKAMANQWGNCEETNSLTNIFEVRYDYDEFEDGEIVEQIVVDGKKYIDIEYFAKVKVEMIRKKENSMKSKECSTCTDRLNYISLSEKYDQLESIHEVLLQDNLTYEEQIAELEKKLENIEKQTRKDICNEIKEKIFEMAFNVNNEEVARFSLALMEYIINVVQKN